MKIKKTLSTLTLSSISLLISTSQVFAQIDSSTGIYTHEGEGVVTFSWIVTLMKNFLSTAITLAGIGAFVMLLLGSFNILSSGGDPKSMEKAQQTITYAITGLIIAVLAGFIFQILGNVLGIDLLTIKLPNL